MGRCADEDCCYYDGYCTGECGYIGVDKCCELAWTNHCTRPLYQQDYPDGSHRVFGANRRISEIVTARGLVTRFTYSSDDPATAKLMTITDGYGRAVTFDYYTTNGRLHSITAPDGGVTTFGYDASGQLVSITDPLGQIGNPAGHVQSFEYETNSPHRMTKETLKNGHFFGCQYDDGETQQSRVITDSGSSSPQNRIVEVSTTAGFFHVGEDSLPPGTIHVTDGEGHVWDYERDGWRRVIRITTPEENPNDPSSQYVSRLIYGTGDGPQANRLTDVTNVNGTRHFVWNSVGAKALIRDAMDNETSFAYDESLTSKFPLLPVQKTEPSGANWYYAYNDQGDLTGAYGPITVLEQPWEDDDKTTTNVYTYYGPREGVDPNDPINRPGRIHAMTKTDRRGYGTTWEYDTDGKLTSKTAVVDEQHSIVTTYEHDAMGRMTRQTVQRDAQTSSSTMYVYDRMGRLTNTWEDIGGLNLHTVYTYDGHGLLETVTSPRGTVTKYVYDIRNRLWQVIEDFGQSRANYTTVYGYDSNGNRTLVTDANGNDTTFVYNVRNHMIQSVDAEGYYTYYDRDPLGNMTGKDRGRSPGEFTRGTVLATEHDENMYFYDNLGRVTRKLVSPDSLQLETLYVYPTLSCNCGGIGGSVPKKITDPAGRITVREFDLQNRVTRVIRKVNDQGDAADDDDAVTDFTYDPEGNLVMVVGPDREHVNTPGETTIYTYDGAGRRLTERKLADPNDPNTPNANDLITNFVWDGTGNLVSTILPNGHTLTAEYDDANRLLRVHDGGDPNSPTLAEYTYDAGGNVLTRTDGEDRTWTYTYDRLGRLKKEYDPLHPPPSYQDTEYLYDAMGNLLTTRNPNWVYTKREYDGLNRLIQVIENYEPEEIPIPSGRTLLDGQAVEGTQEEGVLVEQESGSGGGQMGPTLELLETSTPTENTTTTYIYDGSRLIGMKDHEGSIGYSGHETTWEYDGAGRVTKVTYPGSSELDPDYVTYTYPGNRFVKRTDQRGIIREDHFGDLGHLYERKYSGPGIGREEHFAFDRSGRLLEAVRLQSNSDLNKRFAWSRIYDRLGRPTREDEVFYSQGGTEIARYATTDFAYAIDAENHEMSWTMTTPSGRNVVHTLDRLNRLVEAAMLDSQSQVVAGVTEWTYNLASRRTGATLANGVGSAFDYDGAGRLNEITHTFDPGGSSPVDLFHVQYGYDLVGNRKYTRNVLDDETVGDSIENRSERYGYDNLNRLTVMDRGSLNANGSAVVTPYWHAVLGRTEQWADLDRRGNWLDHRWDRYDGESFSYHQETREANGVNEYTEVTRGSIPYVPTYDEAGNLTMDPWARNVGASTPPGQEYVYDEENRVVEVKRHSDSATLAQYEYDALGRRVLTTEYFDPPPGETSTPPGITRHVYVGLETVEEYNVVRATEYPYAETATLAREFVWGDPSSFPEPVAMVDYTDAGQASGICGTGVPPVGCVYHYLHDVLGSVIGLVDSTGAMVERYMYDPYGRTYAERWDPTANEGAGGWLPNIVGGATGSYSPICYSAFGNPWMWTGQRYDASTGLYAFLFRTYSPTLGRWLQRDPERYVDGVNLYQYVAGNPLLWIDPLGLCLDPKGGIGYNAEDYKKGAKQVEGLLKADTGEFLSDDDIARLADAVMREMRWLEAIAIGDNQKIIDEANKVLNDPKATEKQKKEAQAKKDKAEKDNAKIRSDIEKRVRENAKKNQEMEDRIKRLDEAKKKEEERKKKEEEDKKKV